MQGSKHEQKLGKNKSFIGKKGKAFHGKKAGKGGAMGAIRRIKGKC